MTYQALQSYYEDCLKAHGATHRGVDWPDADDLTTRFDVMTSWLQWDVSRPLQILDVGCGPGLYLEYLQTRYHPDRFAYRGVDISPAMIAAANARHPQAQFEARDLIKQPLPADSADYAIFNGVFTVRHSMSVEEMTDFAGQLLGAVFPSCRKGLAVNFMAPHADWYDDSLFYFSFDAAAKLFKQRLSRHFSFRSDYGLWEYTALIEHAPA